MGDVVRGLFPVESDDPKFIANKASSTEWGSIMMVIGWDKDDNLVIGRSNQSEMESIYLLEKVKNWILSQ